MKVEYHDHGIYLPEIEFWLDSTIPCPATWISHGHSDHAQGCHGVAIGTSETLRFYRMRLLLAAGETEPECRRLEFGESMPWRDANLTAYPAGHILGAAQLLIEFAGERLLYTGDVKLKEPICGAIAAQVACDRLIIESTFGLPIYNLLPTQEGSERIARFAKQCLQEDGIPVFIGYSLGRGQEIVHVLSQAGIPTAVHGAIAKFIPAYEQAGYGCDGWEPYEARAVAGKAVVTIPGHASAIAASLKKTRIAYVSGWAALANARARTGAEELIPYSDHADFGELLEIVRASGARRIDVVHGYTGPFAHILQTKGWEAFVPEHAGERSNVEAIEG